MAALKSSLPLIRLLIVDDSVLVRLGIRDALTGKHAQVEIQIIGEAGTVAEAISAAHTGHPDVVLLDIRLPDGDGFAACRALLKELPATRILMLTSFANDDFVHQAIVSGAHGYMMKEADPERLIEAIHRLYCGESVLGADLVARVIGLVRSGHTHPLEPSAGLDSLSSQERRVLALVAEGRTNKEIGLKLGLSDNTVKNYLVNVFDKLNIKRRSQAAAIWVQASQKST